MADHRVDHAVILKINGKTAVFPAGDRRIPYRCGSVGWGAELLLYASLRHARPGHGYAGIQALLAHRDGHGFGISKGRHNA